MKLPFYISLLFAIISCSESIVQHAPDSVPIHESFTLSGEFVDSALNPIVETRTINVWLPEAYKTGTDSLPVMYMLDGGIKEDFPHIANTLQKMIAAGEIPPILLVGIENTQRRRDLTGFTDSEEDKTIAPIVGRSEDFRKFLQTKLIPHVEQNYSTNTTRTIIGESLAGLFIIETFLLQPELFDNYIAFDPSLWWNNEYLIKNAPTLLQDFPSTNKKLWFASAGKAEMKNIIGRFAKALPTKNLPHLQWTYKPYPKEKHSTIFRAAKEEAVRGIIINY